MRVSRWSRFLSGAAVLLFVSGASYACKDFLDNPPQGSLDEGTLATQDGVEGLLIAAYRNLDHNFRCGNEGWAHSASDWVFGSVTSDDAYKGSEASDQPAITDIELYNWSIASADAYLNGKWRCLYEGVSRANAVINLLNKVVTEGLDEISTADQDGILGEAQFLRAHYHFELWRSWGNIPYYTEADTTVRKANDLTQTQIIDLLLSDLSDAASLLPATPRNGQAGRATSWTARAYKGKVLVYAERWGDAVTELSAVVTGGPYGLQPSFDEIYTGRQGLYNGPETVLAYQASSNDGESNGDNSNWGERLNHPHGGPIAACCGFHQPTQNLVNFFRTDPTSGLPWALTNTDWNVNGAEWDAAATAPATGTTFDPRLDWTVGRDGVPFKDWGVHDQGWIRQVGYGGPYSTKKAIYELGSGAGSNVGWSSSQTSSMNIHILRYADVLLLLAEAGLENTGDIAGALTIVNQIRARAAQTAQGPVDDLYIPITDARITWANYSIQPYGSFADVTAAMTAVRYERRLELAMEGERFYDLRRWGLAQQVLNDYLAQETANRTTTEGGTFAKFLSAAAAYTSPKYDWYPIPITQIELSRVTTDAGEEDRLTQNSGW